MKVFLVIAMMLAGESEPTSVSAQMPNMLECYQVGWKFVNGPLPENLVFLSTECQVRIGEPS